MIEILPFLDEERRDSAGQIYYEAFRRKLQPLVGRPDGTQKTLTAGFNLNLAVGALVDGRLLGLAGLQGREGVFSQVRLGDCLRHLGALRGVYAWAVLNLFGSGANRPPDHLRIAALAVAPSARGQGLGTRLLQAVFDKARNEGYRAVRLEVVDTNRRARQLYERMGFAVTAAHWYPIAPGWLGFRGDYVMVKTLCSSGGVT